MLSPTVQLGLEDELSLKDFNIDSVLGKGSFGTVSKATHKLTSRVFALKEINKEQIRKVKMSNQVINETKIMYSANHQFIVKLVNHFEDDEKCYLLMEYASNGQVYGFMKKQPKKRLSEKVAAKVTKKKF